MPRMPASTFVYISNADDADISTFTLTANGELLPGPRAQAAPMVMPMIVSPDQRFLYAAIRSQPYAVNAYAIDSRTGALQLLGSAPLVESFPFIALDQTGRYLFAASYASHLISVNAVGVDGRVAAPPRQVIPIGRNAHSIRVDATNRFVFAPALGSDQIFQFHFDAGTGRLTSNTPAVARTTPGTGPRHFELSRDNKFLYVVGEFEGVVTSFSLDAQTGCLTEVGTVRALPGTTLQPGLPRLPIGTPGAGPARNLDNDIWAADLHLTPDGRFLYISERTGSTISALRVDGATGKLTHIGTYPTEKQPRSFAIDPSSRFLIAAGEKSDVICVHAIDPATGALTVAGKYPAGKAPGWVTILGF